MEYLDAAKIKNEDFKKELDRTIEKGDSEITIQNVHAMHNICAGCTAPVKITIEDSTGLYTASYLENTEVYVKGNAGWYAGDNMAGGVLKIGKNTGCNAGAYIDGGDLVIYGNTGSRVGYGMKAGNIIVGGNAGRWAGQMAMGANLIILGKVGNEIGESMFEGKIFVRDANAKTKLGGNVAYTDISESEAVLLDGLFQKYGLDAKGKEFHVIRPILDENGKHKYVLFHPVLHPEDAAKYRVKEGA